MHSRLNGGVNYRKLCRGSSSGFSEQAGLYHVDFISPNSDNLSSDNDSSIKCVNMIETVLKSIDENSELEMALDQFSSKINEDVVIQILRRHRSDYKLALSFFTWASMQPCYTHGLRAYNEMLDILGRMKQIKLMRQLFDEIPKDGGGDSIVNDKTFAILMNRYAAAHKVQEAIDIFYKRKEFGYELDLVGFQTLLMSLCRYKHVEEAEALFLQKQKEFPPVIKSRNIILNGWCVLGSLRDTKRFWNDIISSKCKPDLFTYGIFINSLTKAGKLGSAVKLFTSMWEKGINPDIKRMEKVYELLDEMEEKGCLPNARTFSYILKTMKKPEEVDNLLGRMERGGCRIDGDTYNLILNLYVEWKYHKGVRYVWSEMERSGLGPDQRSFTVMIHGLYAQGKLDEALQYYNEMKAKGMIPEPRTRIIIKAIHLKREGENSGSDHSRNSVEKRRFVS
uniref:Pentatricopeptide repeat-containing protein At3g15200 n=1 Tax=Ananas comosus var. bracteatus TaxID=296719 RepID=A0A6V7PBV9_ANACO|nr:unnamed protein product [Ananas comosus var. bracteatus]